MKTAIIGGDKRMLYAAKAFSDDGAEVAAAGFDNLQSLCDIRVMSVKEALKWADFSVLPVRPVDGGCINMPYAAEKITLHDFARMNGAKPVFSGFSESIANAITAPVCDYAAREEFAVRNAVLTAEGAVALLINEYEDSVSGAKALVIGYGRIGKVLSRYLQSLGAEVTVAARKPSDRAWIEAVGMAADNYSYKELSSYQIVFNTVPAPVLDAACIDRLRDDVMLIDLASAPGGVDFDRAGERGLTCIHALGLPGKSAPKAAGRIIKDTIIHIIKEENGGKDYSGLCDDRLLLHL